MNHIRLNLDESFKENLSYEELAVIAGMSKSDMPPVPQGFRDQC